MSPAFGIRLSQKLYERFIILYNKRKNSCKKQGFIKITPHGFLRYLIELGIKTEEKKNK